MRPRSLALLGDIRESIAYIAEDIAGLTFDEFARSRRVRQLVIHNFEIIGEAMHRLRRDDPETIEQISSPNQYIALRNVLIHGYDVIEYSIVWNVVMRNLPTLEMEVTDLLQRDVR